MCRIIHFIADQVEEEKRLAKKLDDAATEIEHREIHQGGPSVSPGLMAPNTSHSPVGSDVDAEKRQAQEDHAAKLK